MEGRLAREGFILTTHLFVIMMGMICADSGSGCTTFHRLNFATDHPHNRVVLYESYLHLDLLWGHFTQTVHPFVQPADNGAAVELIGPDLGTVLM